VLGLVGESGSGKTSLARCIAGLAEPSAGSLEVDGDAVPWPLRERPTDVRNAVQMVFQNPDGALNPSLRVDRLLRRTLRRLGGDGDAGLEELAALVRLSPGELELRPVHSPAG
jgi:peptide/nickel transport system ATP-binding protein